MNAKSVIVACFGIFTPVVGQAQTVSVVPRRSTSAASRADVDALSARIDTLRKNRALRSANEALVKEGLQPLIALPAEAADHASNIRALEAANDSLRAIAAEEPQPGGQQDVTLGLNGGANTKDGDSQASPYLGFVVTKPTWHHEFLLNLSTSNVIEGDRGKFGAFLLNPGSDALALRTGGNHLVGVGTNRLRGHVGAYYNVGVALADWKTKLINGTDTTERSRRAGVWYLSLGGQLFSRSMQYDSDTSNIFTFGLEGGATSRWLTNDVLDDRDLRDSTIGTSRRFFVGPELTLFAVVKQARPYVRLTWFDPKLKIAGFTNFQTFIGVDVLTSLFNSEIPKKKEAEKGKGGQ